VALDVDRACDVARRAGIVDALTIGQEIERDPRLRGTTPPHGARSLSDKFATEIPGQEYERRTTSQHHNARQRAPCLTACLGWGLEMRLIVVMAHDIRLLTTALYADEYLFVQIKGIAD